jgi:glycosyltransferase involved in cell wall biosynthesis
MRILSISNCPALEHLGSGYIIAGFCNGLRERGHDVDLFEADEYEVLKSCRPRANSHRQAVGMARLISRLPVNQYDVIEFWGAESWLALSLMKRRRRSTLVVHHTNGPEIRYGPLAHAGRSSSYSRLVNALFRRSFSLPDGIITLNNYDKQWLIREGLEHSGRLESVEPGLSLIFHQLDITGDRPRTVGFCGSWLPRKGTELIQNELPPILREFREWRLQLIGVGKSFDKRDHFPADVLSQIDVVPFEYEKQKLILHYLKMAIFIFPSQPESFGMVLAEAMACGCAVVATKVGFGSTLLDNREALLLDAPVSETLRVQLRKLMLHEDLRSKIASAGAQRARQLTWPRAIDQYENILSTWRCATSCDLA